MRISELITALQKAQDEHGDLVVVSNDFIVAHCIIKNTSVLGLDDYFFTGKEDRVAAEGEPNLLELC